MSNDPIIELENVIFTYSGENQQASGIKDINLHINSGELVVLCGNSGCGKTTVTRLINGLIPHYYEGELSGRVRVCGQNVSEQPLYDTARITGSVFQNPRSQFFNVDTTSEITFGCENLGMPENEIRCRLERVTDRFHLENLLDRNIFMLSGGEKQKIACAGVSIMEPEVMILDEPSSNLDVKSTMELKAILKLWKEEGKTIVVSEHRLYYLSELADRYIYLEDGKIRGNYTKEEFLDLGAERRLKMGLRCFSMDEESLSTEIRNFTLVASEKQQLEHKKISFATLELQDFTYAYYVVTHDFEMIPSCCTAVIHLENGEIQETYPVDEAGIQKRKEYFIKQYCNLTCVSVY